MSSPTKTRMPRRSSRSVLMLLAFLLATSGLIRIGSGTGLAVAREVQPLIEKSAAKVGPKHGLDDGVSELLAALQKRSNVLDSSEQEFDARVKKFEELSARKTAELEKSKAEISQNLLELRQAEQDLAATIAMAESASEGDIARLTEVYENMKPKKAALLFEEMAPEFAAGFLARMQPAAAAAIMAGLTSQKAYGISVILAGRNATVPKT